MLSQAVCTTVVAVAVAVVVVVVVVPGDSNN